MSEAYEQIKASATLPSPVGVALEILRLVESESSDVQALGAVIAADPALSARLLQLANSPATGQSASVSSIDRAVVILGFSTVAVLALGLSLISTHRKGHCVTFDYDGFWSDSLARAVAASHIASRVQAIPADEAFACALLSRIGELALATAFPERYASVIRDAAGSDLGLCKLERREFGLNHYELGAEMLEDWNLPEPVWTVLIDLSPATNGPTSKQELDEITGQLSSLIRLSAAFAHAMTESIVDREQLATMARVAWTLGISPDQLPPIFDESVRRWRESGRIFEVPVRSVLPLSEIYSRCAVNREDLLRDQTRQPD